MSVKITLFLLLIGGFCLHPVKGQQDTIYPDREVGEVYEQKSEGALRVGLAKASISPHWPVRLSYGSQEPTTGTYDSTWVKVMLFRVDNLSVVWAEFDVIGIRKRDAEYIKEVVAKNIPVSPKQVIVAATHNHSYPRTHRQKVRNYMARQARQALEQAWEKQFPAQVGVGKARIREDLNLNRAELDGLANPLLYVIRVEDTSGHLRGLHYNYGTHPTIFTEWGNSRGKIGPNWPGLVNHYVKSQLRYDLKFQRYEHKSSTETDPMIMYSQGAAGDQQPRRHTYFIDGEQKPSKYIFCKLLGREVLDLTGDISTQHTVSMQFRSKVIDIPYKNGSKRESLLQSFVIDSTAFATMPGELNVQLGYKFEEHSPYPKNVLITNADDYIGYIVREEIAVEKVTYQGKDVEQKSHYGEKIVDESLRLLDPDYEGTPPLDTDQLYGAVQGKIHYQGENTIAVGVRRTPGNPNYAGGFWGQRTVVKENGTWRIDSLAPGQFYVYVVEADPENPRPPSYKSDYEDIRDLLYGYPVTVRSRHTTRNVNFQITDNYLQTGVEKLTLNTRSLGVDGYSVSGEIDIEGKVKPGETILVKAYHAHYPYRSLFRYLQQAVVTTKATSQGKFTFKSLPPGQYRIVAMLDVNQNQLPEGGIDRMTNYKQSPVIKIPSSKSKGK